ncbi:phosphotyrosine-specific ptp2-like protein [Exophiala xenobiotica]|uniref:protein-tyrosine-phosphatase n=1 Tax=Lithohypha guttulata TaxID=1690604 RepID=A0ABR0K6J0_9EURO|nr:phosphotyrosine-specific ptp2-like protein [Lithohypha guttulata]KAK5314650.1 phosphotyrosine-specific ptp2-like protein [Exophiala xenobiotica]
MTTTATPSSWKASSHSHSSSRSSRPLTTPRSSHPITTPSSQMKTQLSPTARTPHNIKDVKGASPSYFGFVVGDDSIPPDSGPGPHARQNWNESSRPGSRPASRPMHNERNPEFELFRRQSEKNVSFALNTLPQTRTDSFDSSQNQSNRSPVSPANTGSNKLQEAFRDDRPGNESNLEPAEKNPFFLGVQRQGSPLSMSPQQSVTADRHSRLSLPAREVQGSLGALRAPRCDTFPPQPNKENSLMLAPQEVAQTVDQHSDKTLILDLRVYPQYASSRLKGALNLCIPTTLLKRPAFTVQKLADTFTSDQDKATFNKWRTAEYIIVYDATSSLAKEAVTSFNVLKKFVAEDWKGKGLVVKGGFAACKKLIPRLIDQGSRSSTQGSSESTLSISPQNHQKIPVAGGCQMPSTQNAANPFFGNIRQNMDLLDGVGQLPIKKPADMNESEVKTLPTWLRRAASVSNEGRDVSNSFLGIEKSEQQRMQKALSTKVSYGTPTQEKSHGVQVAGIEKGSKNRYNNIFPFEHSRVRLQNVPAHGCDYINASFVKASYSNRKYIATQAPIPQTFDDFWRVVWEQDIRVIVMLTAESEGGQVKSHSYWKSGEYGSVKVKQLGEKRVSLTAKADQRPEIVQRKSNTGRRLTTSNATPTVEKRFNFEPTKIEASSPKLNEEPSVVVRHFGISHSSHPFSPMKDITQLQYTQWPDFGAPASPTAILSLIDLVDNYQRNASSPATLNTPNDPVNEGQKPIMVHCSAGCGRTGTFCTIDSVIDMLKRQRLEQKQSHDAMDVDSEDDWAKRDDIDLVAKAVDDFRHQRLSMVQNLRQFVLCYESIIQWLHERN